MRPGLPWLIVQPMAVTPPTPMSAAPVRWCARSSVFAKPCQRNSRVYSACAAAPAMTPSTDTTPTVSTLLRSLKNSSQSSVWARGAAKLSASMRPV